MKKSMKLKKEQMKKMAIIGLICIIAVCFVIVLMPKKVKTPEGIEVVNTGTRKNEEITEEDAKKATVKQFKKIGEESVTEENITALKIEREDGYYYYMTSKQNTMEIKIVGGKVTRINSTPIENK